MTAPRRRDRIGYATGLFGWVALPYLAGSVLAWQTSGAGIGPAFFPPAGVTVAAMLLTRRALWPVIVAAVVVGELAVDLRYGTALTTAAGFALANSVEPLVGASLVRFWCKGPPDLRERADLARFVAGAMVVGPLAGGVIGGAVTAVDSHASWPIATLLWWAGDGVGVLMIGAPILLWPLQSQLLRARRLETVVVLGAMAGLTVVSFRLELPPALFLLPVMAWAALRLEMIGAALCGAVLAFTANIMANAGYATFESLDLHAPGQLAIAQAFIAVVVLVAMLTAQEAAGRVTAVRQRQAERRERARLETLANLGRLLSGAFTQNQIGDAVVGQVINDAGAQALTVGLVNDEGTALEWVAMGGYPESVVEQFAGGLALDECAAATDAVRTGQPVVIRTIAEYRRRYPDNARWMMASGGAAVVSWPLTVGGKAIGVLVLAWSDPQPLDTAQLAYTSAVATMIGQALVRARVYADEHARAAVLQAAVLPTSPAPIDRVDVGVSYEPADVVQGLGGDWYDALELPHGRMYLAVGDVVGHGLPAVEDMAQLRSAGRAVALQGLPPARLLAELNTFTRHASNGKFATMGVAVLDPVSAVLAYASAGHPPPLLRRSATGEVIRLGGAHGPVLGPVDRASYGEGDVQVSEGDILVMYTDGLIERRGQDIESGITRVQRLVAKWSGDEALLPACRELTQILAPPPRDDDVCVVAVRFGAIGGPRSPDPASRR
ncbi:SpoIIE family protein phosphatase [Mycobacterium sp. CVI_P3]|uniref:SpoIIE family protein phosphatase n=1 Tax=Mycobacterium pinniadriaticum TaxID=2994102 RepID=A0ABT3SAI9_9MYCO|nr:SpoIIE family protein phosphatase [Mycobacterium pinniadriaticum]MCX2929820.1 SpoIIE family protein phosphatase [Mycobacterium pinniadriaticum]MCX2936531.1 SpoIIE family protein phosphatase [Mycobacterium pinniadriaticum]